MGASRRAAGIRCPPGYRCAMLVWPMIFVACDPHVSTATTHSTLALGVVANVGPTAVSVAEVARVAAAEQVPTSYATETLVQDALLERAALAEHLETRADVQWAVSVAIARTVTSRLQAEALAQGPPSDDEVAEVTVARVLVMRSSVVSDDTAHSVAQGIHRAVEAAKDTEDFRRRAEASPSVGTRVVFDGVATFRADGQLTNRRLSLSLVAAAFALSPARPTSPVIETNEGWSILRLVDRLVPDETMRRDRKESLADAIVSMRARSALDELLRGLKERVGVRVVSTADALMARAVTDSP